MTLLRDPADCGFLRRLIHVYREKRSPVPVLEYQRPAPGVLGPLQKTYRRPARWACWQIAWRQARNAHGL